MAEIFDEIQAKRAALKDNIEKALPSASFQKQGVFTEAEFRDELKKGYDVYTPGEVDNYLSDLNKEIARGKVTEEDYAIAKKGVESFQKADVISETGNRSTFLLKKKSDPDVKAVEDELEKGAKGEGSKGGKVIGHTKSGKPIYEHTMAGAKHMMKTHAPGLHKFLTDAELESPHSYFKGSKEKDFKDMEESYKKHKTAMEGQASFAGNEKDADEYKKAVKEEPGMRHFHKHVGEESGWGDTDEPSGDEKKK